MSDTRRRLNQAGQGFAEEEQGNRWLDDACKLARENESQISPSDMEIVRDRINVLKNIKEGLQSKTFFSRNLQAQKYCESAQETFQFVKMVSDRANDARLGQSDVLSTPSSNPRPVIVNTHRAHGLGLVAKQTPSGQKKRGDQWLKETSALVEQYGPEMDPSDRSLIGEKIIHANEVKSGVDSKSLVPRYLHARDYRKVAKNAYQSAKTASQRVVDAALAGHRYDPQPLSGSTL